MTKALKILLLRPIDQVSRYILDVVTVIKPEIPRDESVRLETLRNLKILDTRPEERFDRVTRLAKRLFGVKFALVTLVDTDRQWFKSSQGLDVLETPRDISFCGHAILGREVLVVRDTHIDERFSDNPLVQAYPGIRFYAGCPLAAPNGQNVGTLCLIDDTTREMSDEDLQLLKELGQMVEEEFAVAEIVNCDTVTGISNRDGFIEIGRHLLGVCERNNLPITLVQFTLPNLTLIRRATGDAGADRAVVELAELLMTNIRSSDVIGRSSDDEFLMLITGADEDCVADARQRIMDLLDKRNQSADATYELEVTAYSLRYQPDAHINLEGLIDALLNGEDQSTESTGRWNLAQVG